MIDAALLTDSRVNRAGKTLRYYVRDSVGTHEKAQEALDVLIAFRALHQRPLTSANMGLRSMVKTTGCIEPEVTQRLKRIPTVLNKLTREPTLALAKMQDLGGCRAVLQSPAEVYRVRDRLVSRGRVEGVSDYIASPRASGYRGVHVIVLYHGRKIEVQLRTQIMHQWAVTVEALSGVLGRDVKSGSGPEAVQKLMETISRAMALEEHGGVVDDVLLEELRVARVAATPYLVGGKA